MRPIIEGMPDIPGAHGVEFETFAELDVLANGLKVIDEAARNAVPWMPQALDTLRQSTRDIAAAAASLLAKPHIDKLLPDDKPIKVTFRIPHEVYLAEYAVRVVASNPPETTVFPELQDPLQYQEATDMLNDYTQAARRQHIPIPGITVAED